MTRDARLMTEDDLPQVLDLLGLALRWPTGEYGARLWQWKHLDNPFGRSVVFVGTEASRVVSVRTFMRWRLRDSAGTVWEAARAVDTATHPDHQRQGWMRRLTLDGLGELERLGTALVFNTPNDLSGPVNIRLGWHDLPRPRVWVRPTGPRSLALMMRSRTAADLLPVVTTVGADVAEALGRPEVHALVASLPYPKRDRLATERSETYLRWRYGHPDHGYRMVVHGSPGRADGAAIVRTRRRGPSLERSVLEVIGAADAGAREPGVDYSIAVGDHPGRGWWRLPLGSPRLVWRAVIGDAACPDLELSLGDLEGF